MVREIRGHSAVDRSLNREHYLGLRRRRGHDRQSEVAAGAARPYDEGTDNQDDHRRQAGHHDWPFAALLEPAVGTPLGPASHELVAVTTMHQVVRFDRLSGLLAEAMRAMGTQRGHTQYRLAAFWTLDKRHAHNLISLALQGTSYDHYTRNPTPAGPRWARQPDARVREAVVLSA